jgi:hypothetical protein
MVPIPLGRSPRPSIAAAAVPVVIDAAMPILTYERCASLAAGMNDWSEG